MASRPDDTRSARAHDAYRYAGAGLQFAAALGVFGGAGYALDRWLGTLPLFLLLGILVGFASATYSLVIRLSGPSRRTEAPPDEPGNPEPTRSPPPGPTRHKRP